MKNVPYVKITDNFGNVKNPIKGGYLHDEPNRFARREPLHKNRFYGNGKNIPLTVLQRGKYLRHIQIAFDKKTGVSNFQILNLITISSFISLLSLCSIPRPGFRRSYSIRSNRNL